jgi:hypothetical protein
MGCKQGSGPDIGAFVRLQIVAKVKRRDDNPIWFYVPDGFLLVAVATLVLAASGCGSKPQSIGGAKAGSGTVPKTRLVIATLN